MEVYHLSKFYKPFSGGLESVVADIAEGMPQLKCSVLAADPNGLPAVELINNVQVCRSKELFYIASTSIAPGYIVDVVRASRKKAILHVHLPNPMANVALYWAWLMGADLSNIVLHWHSDIVKQKHLLALYKPLQSWLLRRARRIVVTSERYLVGSETLAPFVHKCIVVPIGIEGMQKRVDPELVSSIRSKYGASKLVFSLGRHVYYKGFEYLIEAARGVGDTVFLIGGSGPDTEKYRAKIKEYGLEGKVFLIGRVDDENLPSYYAAADVFCFPSIEKSEAFGVVQLEAMSVGTPVVSTNIAGSGVPWVNKHMNSGVVCSPKDSNALASALEKILFEPEVAKRMAKGARARFEEVFTRERMVDSIQHIYNEFNV